MPPIRAAPMVRVTLSFAHLQGAGDRIPLVNAAPVQAHPPAPPTLNRFRSPQIHGEAAEGGDGSRPKGGVVSTYFKASGVLLRYCFRSSGITGGGAADERESGKCERAGALL